MDRRAFLALMSLAAAAGSPALADQVRRAQATGEMHHISREELLRSIYRVCLSPNGVRAGAKALTFLGHSPGESMQMANIAVSIVRKAGSFEGFHMIIDGRPPRGVMLSPQEVALLRAVSRRPGTIWDGRTWEGSALARRGDPRRPPYVWDGRTWEGSAM